MSASNDKHDSKREKKICAFYQWKSMQSDFQLYHFVIANFAADILIIIILWYLSTITERNDCLIFNNVLPMAVYYATFVGLYVQQMEY